MRRIKSKDTSPELLVRKITHKLGYRFRLHRKDLPGKPDLTFPARKKIIFVHGCFWHQHKDPNCRITHVPRTNTGYWVTKLEKNIERDRKYQNQLREKGWLYLIIWECETKDLESLTAKIDQFLSGKGKRLGDRHVGDLRLM